MNKYKEYIIRFYKPEWGEHRLVLAHKTYSGSVIYHTYGSFYQLCPIAWIHADDRKLFGY